MFKENHRSTTRKRLLLIGPLPPPFAGPEIGTKTLHESPLLNRTYDIRLINTTVRVSNRDKGRFDLHLSMAYIRYIWKLIHALVSFRPHYVLYTPTSASLKGWVRDGTTLLLSGSYTKLLMQFRGGHFLHFYNSLSKFLQIVIRWLLKRCDLVLVQAERLKSQFAGHLPEERVHTLYNSIATEFFNAFENVDRHHRAGEFTILFVGHLSTAKGYCDLLKTVPLLAGRYGVRYRFMGAMMPHERNVLVNQVTGETIPVEDPGKVYEKYVVSKGFASCVEFLGDRIDGMEKERIFSEADIFVLPSYSEGFSRAILEALAAGLPMVVTCVGAVPEILQDGINGYIINPGDVNALTDRITRLIQNHAERIEMGKCNHEYCRKHFLEEVQARRLIEILENL